MHQFLPNAVGLLKKYKLLLKKKFPQEEYQKSLIKLQLNDSLPRDEVNAYRSLVAVMNQLKKQTQAKFDHMRFSGTLRFLRDVEELLNWYRVEKNKVVHASQEASTAMVMAIQLIILPPEKRTEKIAMELEQYALKIAQHAVNEQKLVFWNSLKKMYQQDESFFGPLITRYREYLDEHAGVGVLMELTDEG